MPSTRHTPLKEIRASIRNTIFPMKSTSSCSCTQPLRRASGRAAAIRSCRCRARSIAKQDLQQVYNTTAYVPSPLTFKPDHLWSYELGQKFDSPDRRFSVNAAEYFEHWSAVQQSVPLTCGFTFAANAGDAHIYGSELEIDAALAPGLVLTLAGGYTHGRFVTSGFNGLEILTGEQLQNIPEVTTSQSLSYRRPLSDEMTLIARVDNNYIGSRIDVSYGVNQVPSYDIANGRVGIEIGRLVTTVFVNNLANKRAIIDNVFQYNINLPTYSRATVNQPLTAGIELAYRLR